MDRLSNKELLLVTHFAGDPLDLLNQFKESLADTMRENEELKLEISLLENALQHGE